MRPPSIKELFHFI